MKQLVLAILLYLSLVSTVTVAADSATEPKVDPALTGQSFCGVKQRQDAPAKKEAGSIESLFEIDIFQSHFDKDCLVVVGLKGWMNTWSLPPMVNGNEAIEAEVMKAYVQNPIIQFQSAKEFTLMPTLTFRYKNLYLSANHFVKTSYSFGSQKVAIPLYPPSQTEIHFPVDGGFAYIQPVDDNSTLSTYGVVETSIIGDRSELDLTLGYYLNEYLALTVGYKKIKRNYSYRFKIPGYEVNVTARDQNGSPLPGKGSFEIPAENFFISANSDGSGLTLGVLSAVPIRGKLSLYGNLVYGRLTTTLTSSVISGSDSTTTPYYSGEVGFAYELAHFKEVGFSTYLGYRFQRYEFENATESGQTARDGTDGFIISFSAYF